MKKNYLFGMALMASLAFFSCTNEVIYVHDGESSEQVSDEQIITLQVSNGGDGLTTRAGRPLYSSEAKQEIDKVYVYFCTGGSVAKTQIIENWISSSTTSFSSEYTDNGHGREGVLKFTGNDKLVTGEYTVYAIGCHSTTDYTDLASTLSGISTSSTEDDIKDLVLTYGGTDNAEEIFAGSQTLTINNNGGGKATVILNRQVAGAFVYLKDIPYFDDAATLELVASSTNNQLVLGQFANTDFESNGDNSVDFSVINGWNSEGGWTSGKAKETVIAKITLLDWFTSIANNNGLIDVTKWKNKYANQSPKPTFQKGSVFAGTFLIPFSKVNESQTLKLVMKAGQTSSYKVLASWNINLSAANENYTNLYTWNGSAFAGNTTEELNINSYSIVRNHLYGIGTRMEDDPGNGTDPEPTDPEKPDPDIDDPESLNNKQELTLRVNDNWEIIHEMVID